MNIYDLLQNNAGVNITINAGQLIKAIDYCVNKTRKELEQQITDANTETYPSPDQVSKILDVDKNTLWRWRKQGYLMPIEVVNGFCNSIPIARTKRFLLEQTASKCSL